MQWEFIIALLIAIPVILFPVVLIWYMNMRGVYVGIRSETRQHNVIYPDRKIKLQNLDLAIVEEDPVDYEIESNQN